MKNRYLHFAGLVLYYLLVFIAVMATVLPFTSSKEWYFRVFDYPRLQTFVIAVLAFTWFAIFYFQRKFKGYLTLGLLLGVMVIQAYKAAPYTPLGKKQVLWSEKDPSDTTHISIFISNVLQTNTAYGKVIERVEEFNPDIVITTESNRQWQAGLSVLEKDYPFRMAIPHNNTYGMHLFSKLPLEQSSIRYLIEPDIPSIRTKVRLRSGEWVHLFVVHPRPPVPGEAMDSRERDAEIIMVGREARKEKGGVIVAGDFNDVAWSETTELFQEVSGFLDPRRGRGFYNTFHAKYPVFRWPLDHLFHSSHFKLVAIERVESVNSDHFPVYVKLSYEPEEKADQPKVEADEDTAEEATETIQKGKEDARQKKNE